MSFNIVIQWNSQFFVHHWSLQRLSPAYYEENIITNRSWTAAYQGVDSINSLPTDCLLAWQLTFAGSEHTKVQPHKEFSSFWSGFMVTTGEKGQAKQWFASSHRKRNTSRFMATRQKLQKWLQNLQTAEQLYFFHKKLTVGKSMDIFPR